MTPGERIAREFSENKRDLSPAEQVFLANLIDRATAMDDEGIEPTQCPVCKGIGQTRTGAGGGPASCRRCGGCGEVVDVVPPDAGRMREAMEALIATWRAAAVASRQEAARINLAVKGTTEAETRCYIRAETWDRSANELQAALAPAAPPTPDGGMPPGPHAGGGRVVDGCVGSAATAPTEDKR